MGDPKSLPWQVFGRDVRPATLFLSVYTGYVSAAALLGGTIIAGPAEVVIGAVGMLAAPFMLAAWWARSVRMMLWGLAGSCWLWLTISLATVQSPETRCPCPRSGRSAGPVRPAGCGCATTKNDRPGEPDQRR